MCKVCMVRFRGCLIRDTTSPSLNKPQSQELVTSKYRPTFFYYKGLGQAPVVITRRNA